MKFVVPSAPAEFKGKNRGTFKRTQPGFPQAFPPNYHSATVNYRFVPSGELESWSSGMVTAEDAPAEDRLASQLITEVTNRVAHDLRADHHQSPQ